MHGGGWVLYRVWSLVHYHDTLALALLCLSVYVFVHRSLRGRGR